METMEKEKIRQTVRETYGKIARSNTGKLGKKQLASCCGPEVVTIGEQITDGCSPDGTQYESYSPTSCCGPSNVNIEKMMAYMGYSKEDLASAPEGANMALGCGNPVALATLKPGETVVDLGSGGGFDCFLSAKEVGETGHVIGVDMTTEMITKARANAEKMGAANVEFRLGEIEHLPVADNSADIIMSNCVINLSPDKLGVYKEAYRVLKPGGRLAISDVVATAKLPQTVQENLTLVAACVGGAATIDDIEEMLKDAGFQNIKIQPNEKSKELIREWDPNESENAEDYIVSAYIEGIKPYQNMSKDINGIPANI